MVSIAPSAKLQVNVASNTHVLVNLANLFLVTPFIVVKYHHTNTLPSGCIAIDPIWESAKLHVNTGSTAHVLVNLAIEFLVTPFIVVNHHHTNTLPSGCIAIVFILFTSAKLHVNAGSTAHVLVNLANLFLATQLNHVKSHHTNIFPSA